MPLRGAGASRTGSMGGGGSTVHFAAGGGMHSCVRGVNRFVLGELLVAIRRRAGRRHAMGYTGAHMARWRMMACRSSYYFSARSRKSCFFAPVALGAILDKVVKGRPSGCYPKDLHQVSVRTSTSRVDDGLPTYVCRGCGGCRGSRVRELPEPESKGKRLGRLPRAAWRRRGASGGPWTASTASPPSPGGGRCDAQRGASGEMTA